MRVDIQDRKVATSFTLPVRMIPELNVAARLKNMNNSQFITFLVAQYFESEEYEQLIKAYKSGGGLRDASNGR